MGGTTKPTHDGFLLVPPLYCYLFLHISFFYPFFLFFSQLDILYPLCLKFHKDTYTNVMKKSSDAIVIYHQDDSDQSESDCSRSSPNISSDVEKAIDQSASPKSPPTPQPIKLTSKGAIQLTSSPNNASSNATTNAILNLKINPFFHDKRKWDDSFTVAEKKELTGNIVKAASKPYHFHNASERSLTAFA